MHGNGRRDEDNIKKNVHSNSIFVKSLSEFFSHHWGDAMGDLTRSSTEERSVSYTLAYSRHRDTV